MNDTGSDGLIGVTCKLVRAPEDAGACVGSVSGNGEHAAGHSINPGWCWAESINREREDAIDAVASVSMEMIAYAPNVGLGAVWAIPPHRRAVNWGCVRPPARGGQEWISQNDM